MPPTEVRCPHCQARFAMPDTMLGTVSRCGRCQQLFTPQAPGAPIAAVRPVAAPPPPPRPVVLNPVAPPSSKVTLRPVAPPQVEEEDSAPKTRRRRREPDDEDEGGGLHPALIVGLSAGVVVLLGVVGFLIVRALI